jgi:hypothetical protein
MAGDFALLGAGAWVLAGTAFFTGGAVRTVRLATRDLAEEDTVFLGADVFEVPEVVLFDFVDAMVFTLS